MKIPETAAEFIGLAHTVRGMDGNLERDIRYLWWALSEIRSRSEEPLEVLDCSPVGDALFASLMALRMKPCEAHFLGSTTKGIRAEALMPDLCGVSDYVEPILDGKVPACNPYDAIIIDPAPSWEGVTPGIRTENQLVSLLKKLMRQCWWRFTTVFVRYGQMPPYSRAFSSSGGETIVWGNVPETTIVVGRMSHEWCEAISPPS